MNDQHKMTEEHNPEAWAAWKEFCEEHYSCNADHDFPPPEEPLSMYDLQRAFEAGWVGAIREVVRQQGEMYPEGMDS